ncbi:putative membrane protein [Moryella indoligenes]|uniref:Membrane protein n=1 Tax=Moryella indoligenes TaxID=371674 RepID=A0AAE4ALT8_9FIRM|nr:hypothetical protein [Moryella indoligenes]MDQ0153520.1 putative membrane protein [Moryella indoligenes]
MRHWVKHLILMMIGGALYVLLELLWRGYSHWTMFFLGGTCFVVLGLLNEVIPWEVPLWRQALLGTVIVTAAEFMTGCVVNLWFGWQVWNYSHMPGNILGQICLLYTLLWIPVSVMGIILDDWLRYLLFGEERPHYKLK